MCKVTREKVIGTFKNKTFLVTVLGATFAVALNTKKKSGSFKGNIDFEKMELVNAEQLAYKVPMKSISRTGENAAQSPYHAVDNFLYRVKVDLRERGICRGDVEWERTLNDAAENYSALNGVEFHRSKDTKIWERKS